MSSSAITTPQFQAKIGSIQNQADSSSVYSAGVWSFKNSTALTSVTITDAGNVGIGTAPSAWSSSFKALHIGNGGSSLSATTIANDEQIQLCSNMYYDGTAYKYVVSAHASRYVQNNGTHTFYVAPSGTAGNNITETEAMRITATGTIFSLPTYNNTSGAAVNMGVTSSGEFVRSTSALKYKEDITPISHGLQTVLSMQPIEYKSKCEADKDAAHKFIGFVADWEEANLPALVQKNGEGEVEGFSYDRLTAVLCKAIQEQQAQIEALKAEVAALKAP